MVYIRHLSCDAYIDIVQLKCWHESGTCKMHTFWTFINSMCPSEQGEDGSERHYIYWKLGLKWALKRCQLREYSLTCIGINPCFNLSCQTHKYRWYVWGRVWWLDIWMVCSLVGVYIGISHSNIAVFWSFWATEDICQSAYISKTPEMFERGHRLVLWIGMPSFVSQISKSLIVAQIYQYEPVQQHSHMEQEGF